MTVSYQYEVASSTSGGFTRLLFMWRGSLYKLIYRELLLFLALFGTISAVYRRVLSEEQKRSFEQIVVYCDTFINLIPLSFVLGFYVAYVAGRWWQQYTAIPWPDKVMHSVALYVTGKDEYARMVRRALMRYLNLSLILVLRSISSAVKRRFPTLDHVVDSGFMTSLELELFVSVPSLEFNTYWIPCTWFINLLKEARENGRLSDAQGLKIIMEEFNDFRSKCGMLWSYDWVSIPLVYTQVVTLATYSFFAVALVGRQYIEGVIKPFQMKVDIYFPVFTVLQFFFFMGLLKVAEQLINPFGDDDEDFELNWLIDRHTKVSYLGVDTLMNRCPPLVKDIYYDSENLILPYTEAAASYKRKTYRGSVANMTVPEEKQTMFLPNIMEEEEENVSASPRTSSASLAVHESPIVGNRRSAARKSLMKTYYSPFYKLYHRQSYGQYYRRYYARYYTQHYSGVIKKSHCRTRKKNMKKILAIDTQGGSSPQPSRKLARGSGETVVTLDLHDVESQQQHQQQQQSSTDQSSGKTTNGRPHSSLAGAVKMFATKGKFAEHLQSRTPFHAITKSSKVNIQPWPSATNLRIDLIEGSDQDVAESTKMEMKKLQQARSFNIPSIDVTRSSIDNMLDDRDADEDDDDEEDIVDGTKGESGSQSASRKRSQAMFEARSGSVNRGFLCREASIEEMQEPRCNCDAASSSSGCYNDSCPQRRQQLQRERSITRLKKKRARATRFNSFPKFLAKRTPRLMRAGTPTSTTSVTSVPRQDTFEESLTVSKSSPELTLAVEFGASTSGACERVRARFYAGNEDEEDDDEELKDVVTKRS